MEWLVVNLDTNHISDLARDPHKPACAAVISMLQGGRAQLAISLLHFVELSDPGFRSFESVCELLDSVPVAWAVSTEEIFEEEIALACARAAAKERPPPRVFHDSMRNWSRGPNPASGSAADGLRAARDVPEFRMQLLGVAEDAARTSMMKGDAALAREPGLPLRLAIEAHLAHFRSRNDTYADGLTAESIIERVGGSNAFPARRMFEAVLRERLLQPAQKSTRNDVFDEYCAAYAPYAAVTALDRRTVARARSAKVPWIARLTARLTDVPRIVDQVVSGALSVVPSR